MGLSTPKQHKRAASRAWLKATLAPIRPAFAEVLAITGIASTLALAVPIFVMQVYDRVVFHAGYSTLMGLLIGVLIALLFDWGLRLARARLLQRAALRVDVEVGRRLFDRLMTLRLPALEARPAAVWHALFRDVDTLRNTFAGPPVLAFVDIPFALLSLLLIVAIAPPIAVVLALVILLFAGVGWRSAHALNASSPIERDSTLARDGLIAEILAGRASVKALGLDTALRPLWEQAHATCIARSLDRGCQVDTCATIGTSLSLLSTVLITAVGAYEILQQQMTIGALVAANMLSSRVLAVLNQAVANYRVVAMCRLSIRRLSEVFADETERPTSALGLARPVGHIVVEGVTFRYGDDVRPLLDDVSLAFSPGGVYGLVGPNGSGKTTLLKLMQALYAPDAGRILLDGADLAQFTRTEIVERIGYVPQECALFAGSIRDNIALRRPGCDDDEIVRAASLAGLHTVIIDWPDGYATPVGEAGRRLSAGQRQRIAIARALIGDPPVLLLDEPTSNLDQDAEHDLCDVLAGLARERTVVVVTHSSRLLAACRTMVVLEGGRIAFAGPREEGLRGYGSRSRAPGEHVVTPLEGAIHAARSCDPPIRMPERGGAPNSVHASGGVAMGTAR